MTSALKISFYCLLVLFGLLTPYNNSFAQPSALDPEKWATELDKKGKEGNDSYRIIDSILQHIGDSARTFEFLNKVADKSDKDHHFQARFNCLRAHQICLVGYSKQNRLTPGVLARKTEIQDMLAYAMDEAYRSADDYLITLVSGVYGQSMIAFGELGVAVMYVMNSIDMGEKLSLSIRPYDYQFLSELLYRIREYNSCIKYARKAADTWKNTSQADKEIYRVSCLNTVGLGYHRQNMYDSALLYYNQALQRAKEINRPVWIGIVSGNIAQIFYEQKRYDTAYRMFMYDYRISKDTGYYDNAANSIQWAARTSLAQGNKTIALTEAREAFVLLKLWPDASYLRNTYYTTSQIFRQMGNYDSAFYYTNLYGTLNDSLEKMISTSSTDISKARLNDQSSRYKIEKLNREKRLALQFRNFIIILIVLVSIIAFLYINRQRIRHLHKEQLALQEKKAADTLAREQLEMLTRSLIEKAALVDELQLQLNKKDVSEEKQELASAISSLTIITEDDWQKFKALFEQLYPGFFINLQEKVNDITIAELRMAALTRLKLPTSEIASILGISMNSVYKTKQRLRQRFNLQGEESIEEFIAEV